MKVWNYLFIMIGMMLLFQFAGLETGASGIFELTGVTFGPDNELKNVTTSSSSFFDNVFEGDVEGILAALALAGAALAIGLFAKLRGENLIILPLITGTLVLFIITLNSILQYSIANDAFWISGLVGLLLIPFSIGFVLALVEFFRASD